MDAVTHTLCGIGLSYCRRSWAFRRDAMGVLVAASLLPDIDIVVAFANPNLAALERRTLTHSIIVLPLLGAGFALLIRRLVPALDFRAILFLIFVGASVHLCLDLVNGYGVALLYPLTSERFELPLLFITDPIVLGVLIAALASVFYFRLKPAVSIWVARGAFAVIATYLAAAFFAKQVAWNALNQLMPITEKHAFKYLVPEPLAPFRWKGIYAEDDGFAQAAIYPFTGKVQPLASVYSDSENPLVLRVRKQAITGEIEALIKAPVWSVCERRVSVYDLRFRYFALNNSWDPFDFAFDVDGDAVKLVETGIGERSRRMMHAIIEQNGRAHGVAECGSENSRRIGPAPGREIRCCFVAGHAVRTPSLFGESDRSSSDDRRSGVHPSVLSQSTQ
jgi:membrane-bound metal-dependent hydrolase YbcI (DUF457 family)